MNKVSFCPLTKAKGDLLRVRQPGELFTSYEKYLGQAFPETFKPIYFKEPVYEFESKVSGVRWYDPGLLGNGEYYSALEKTYSWYYRPGSWDKITAVEILRDLNPASILEIGCGDGWLLSRLRDAHLPACGVEINEEAAKKCRAQGLSVFLPGDDGLKNVKSEVLCLLQTIEHVSDPLGFMAGFVKQYDPQQILLSAPCFESVLGYTTDPLSWPPHHFTAWSIKGFQTLADLLGYKVTIVKYTPMSYAELNHRFEREGVRSLPDVPSIPYGFRGFLKYKFYQLRGEPWACRGHSILAVLSKK